MGCEEESEHPGGEGRRFFMLRFPRQAPHCNTDQVHNLSVSQDTEKKMYPFWGKKSQSQGGVLSSRTGPPLLGLW